MCLGMLMCLNMDHMVLKVLGIEVDGSTATIINNMLGSDRQAKQSLRLSMRSYVKLCLVLVIVQSFNLWIVLTTFSWIFVWATC